MKATHAKRENLQPLTGHSSFVALPGHFSRSPKASHDKAGQSGSRDQRFESDTGKMQKMWKVLLTLEKQGSEEIPRGENAETQRMQTLKRRKGGKPEERGETGQ